MKSKATRQTQLLYGLTRMTKRERKALFGKGVTGEPNPNGNRAFRRKHGIS